MILPIGDGECSLVLRVLVKLDLVETLQQIQRGEPVGFTKGGEVGLDIRERVCILLGVEVELGPVDDVSGRRAFDLRGNDRPDGI